jgi:mRNA interferase MazF
VRSKITIAPITTHIRNIPTEVRLGLADGLPFASVADLDSIATIPKSLVRERINALSTAKVAAVEEAIRFALNL